ncbi:amino acid ABC transporter permease [Oscillospiraceae bacterium]|nr:amino acid ABC transporter permease [Oscillospiraceae bacterium]
MSFQTVTTMLLESFGLNCQLFLVTLVLSLPLGLVVSFGSMSRFKPLCWLTRFYVYIMRSTPLMLQLAIVYYLPGIAFGPQYNLPKMTAAALAFVLNYAAYFSEIFRGGIQGVPVGQREAGQVLGMTKSQIFFKVTLLQVVKRIVPPIGNEIITLVKDTSLANFIMVKEIIAMAKDFGNRAMIWPLFYAGVFFLIFNGVVTVLLSRTEKKLDYFKV